MRTVNQPNRIQRVYIRLTQWFSTTFIGLLVGVMTSAAVNILTGEKHLSLFFSGTVVLYFVMCVALYRMSLFRQELDGNEATRKATESDDRKRWQNSCRWDESDFVRRFYKMFCVFLVTLIGAIYLNVNANNEGFRNSETDAEKLSLKIDSIHKAQRVIVEIISAQDKKIEAGNKIQDSIIKLLSKKVAKRSAKVK